MNGKRKLFASFCCIVTVTSGCAQHSSKSAMATPSTTSPTLTSTPVKTLTSDEARQLESKLSSPVKAEQALALVPQLRTGSWSSVAVMPAGSALTFDDASFTVDKDGFGTVNATVKNVNGKVLSEFFVRLALVNGQWLIFQTDRKR